MNFVRCLVYLAMISFLCFLLGRVMPKHWFRYDAFPFKCFSLECDGAVYDHLSIRRWKGKLWDMSTVFPDLMPSKSLAPGFNARHIKLMIQETCVAEFIHVLLSVLGFFCVEIWKSRCGLLVSVLYWIGNIPFCLVQRYNRPKLVRILKRMEERHGQALCAEHLEPIETNMQYEAGM